MTPATSCGLSESRQPRRWRRFSREGLHERVGFVLLEAEIRARLIRLASSVADEAFISFCNYEVLAPTIRLLYQARKPAGHSMGVYL